MEVKSKLIRHCDASKVLLEKIAKLKSIRWNYSIENQLKWMQDNLTDNDYHLLVYLDNNLIAYTNFVDVEVEINDQIEKFRGIGNVCTLKSGKGFGGVLMKEVNNSIKIQNWHGVLFCKDSLVPYYSKYNWRHLSKEIVKTEQLEAVNVMSFNFNRMITKFEYKKLLF